MAVMAMLAAIPQLKPTFQLTFANSDKVTCRGGQLLVDAICPQFDLRHKLDPIQPLDPRNRMGSGFAPSTIVKT